MNHFPCLIVAAGVFLWSAFDPAPLRGQKVDNPPAGTQVAVYPQTYKSHPGTPSPFRTASGEELVLAELTVGGLAYVPVTAENGDPYSCACELNGKGMQLRVSDEFPTLQRTGLHAESALDKAVGITGYPFAVIDCIARPRAFSYDGFISEDESIVAVLKGDNRLVRALGLTHPQLAIPLFHLWNLMRLNYPTGCMIYNGQRVLFSGEPTRSHQESIFRDEIQGTWDISVRRELSSAEKSFLAGRYSRLYGNACEDLEARLSHLRIGEMAPFYIMRYGFYEGHTAWRADPIAISFIFGLRRIEELANAFGDDFYETLTDHYSDAGITK
jgi:hypothetical protein